MIVGFVLTAWSVASTLTHEARGDALHCTFGWVIEGMKSEIIEVVATQTFLENSSGSLGMMNPF